MINRRSFIARTAGAGLGCSLGAFWNVAQAQAPRLPPAGADGWVSLLNGHDLAGWYTMLKTSGRGVAEKRGMVTMEEGMLHIMGNQQGEEPQEPGYIATNREYEDVHIRLEYKWGMKRFAPRLLSKRDNGLLYGLVGEDKVWPTCVECQIEEGDVGDAFMVGTRGVQDLHFAGLFGEGLTPGGYTSPPPDFPMPPGSPPPKKGVEAAPAAQGFDASRFRKIKDGDFENLDGWNTVEVIWQGDRSAHIINGRAVNSLSKLEQPDPNNPGQFVPLTRGKIAIEIEFAEIWIRRLEVRTLGRQG